MEPIEWSPTFHAVDLSLLPLTLPPSLVSMAAQEVMKHRSILEEAAPNLPTNLQSTLASIALVNKYITFFYVDKLFRL